VGESDKFHSVLQPLLAELAKQWSNKQFSKHWDDRKNIFKINERVGKVGRLSWVENGKTQEVVFGQPTATGKGVSVIARIPFSPKCSHDWRRVNYVSSSFMSGPDEAEKYEYELSGTLVFSLGKRSMEDFKRDIISGDESSKEKLRGAAMLDSFNWGLQEFRNQIGV
jgi:hypothetical protein